MANKVISTKNLYHQLDKIFDQSQTIELKEGRKWVIFSDLHMGDGGSTDDFQNNADLFQTVLKDHYLHYDYNLILNGDIEELQRFSLKKIIKRWKSVYDLFDTYADQLELYKTIGNHDLQLKVMKDLPFAYNIVEGLKLQHGENNLFVFHGHQASKKYQEHNELIGFTLKYFANPLGIKSYSVSHSSKKQYKIEKRVYGYSSYNKIVSIIGHTHRPLFESLDKIDRLKYKIEQLCRDFVDSNQDRSDEIKDSIKSYKKELKNYHNESNEQSFQSNMYNSLFHIPCLFNSGCVVGKRGITCLEIEEGVIRLVHWFDKKISKKYLIHTGYEPEPMEGTDFYRMVINEESLDYIFARIRLLA